jgi:hypothetical protein
MSLSWKFLPLAAVAVLGAMAILPGGVTHPTTASAAVDCNAGTHDLKVVIEDDNTSDPILTAGAKVTISPDPQDATGTRTFTDNGSNDDSDTIGEILQSDACEASGASDYTITLDSVPDVYEDCDLPDPVSTNLTANKTITLTLENCDEITPTPAASPTTGIAATVVAQASPNTVSCNGTSIVTIQVKNAQGSPVAVGTQVTIQANIGQVSPSSGQTTSADGSVFVFYTAPSNQGGAATITAKAGNAQGTATVTVNCNAAPTATTAPPPTVNPGSISPPNTGDAGLANGSSDSWIPFAGIAAIVATLAGGLALVVRNRN